MSSYQQTVKKKNKLIVLNTIREQEPISRAKLAQKLGLTKATVSSLVDELISEEYCYQTGLGESSGGRRPLMLQFNQHAGVTISVDIGVNYILAILTDLHGNMINEVVKQFDTNYFSKTVHEIKQIIDTFLANTESTPFGLIGIGFGVPGLVNTDGDILHTPNLSWEDADLKGLFEKQYGVPVLVENEANAGAYGEITYDMKRNAENIIYISLGIGIGVGLILDHHLFRGKSGLTGEMGHMIIETDGLPCRCGSKGCWEMYASELALLTEFQKTEAGKNNPSLEKMIQISGTNDEVKKMFERTGRYVGIGINNIINTFNPEKIIIGNRLAKAQHLLVPGIKEVIEHQTLPHLKKSVDISFSQKQQYSAALGMSAFTIEQFLDKQFQSEEKATI
ncbi:ROK family transcriptional regulator [Evansella halocellulosilytica]|uniref:ROK family transcriptional regulator n=1 Tax=Evansella halocellulosilytica TaxID=2011013 RepID=UPI000BB7631F|nr:ROK family transcriptional regulator [Evansella halocellulosilytica]